MTTEPIPKPRGLEELTHRATIIVGVGYPLRKSNMNRVSKDRITVTGYTHLKVMGVGGIHPSHSHDPERSPKE